LGVDSIYVQSALEVNVVYVHRSLGVDILVWVQSQLYLNCVQYLKP